MPPLTDARAPLEGPKPALAHHFGAKPASIAYTTALQQASFGHRELLWRGADLLAQERKAG